MSTYTQLDPRRKARIEAAIEKDLDALSYEVHCRMARERHHWERVIERANRRADHAEFHNKLMFGLMCMLITVLIAYSSGII